MIKGFREVKPSIHFLHRQKDYGFTPVPLKYDLLKGEIFEYYRTEDNLIEKFCIRCTHMSDTEDMVYIVTRDGRVATGWKNYKNDIHGSLDLSLYEKEVG